MSFAEINKLEYLKFNPTPANIEKATDLITDGINFQFPLDSSTQFAKFKKLIVLLVKSTDNSLSHRFIHTCEKDGMIIGLIIAYKIKDIRVPGLILSIIKMVISFSLSGLMFYCSELKNIIFNNELSRNDFIISYIAVDKTNRQKGIGEFLLEKTIDRVYKNKEVGRIKLYVSESNFPAIKLYDNFEFKTIKKVGNNRLMCLEID